MARLTRDQNPDDLAKMKSLVRKLIEVRNEAIDFKYSTEDGYIAFELDHLADVLGHETSVYDEKFLGEYGYFDAEE